MLRKICAWMICLLLLFGADLSAQADDSEGASNIEIEDGVLVAFKNQEQLSVWSVPENVKGIDYAAFCAMEHPLDTLHIPADCMDIDVTENLLFISNFSVSEDHPLFTEIDGILYSKDCRELILYPAGRDERIAIIPEGTVRIGAYAFYGSTLENVVFPSSLEYIGPESFSGCVNLTELVFNDGLQTIETGAFSECYSLSTVTFPDTLKEIGGSAFDCCNQLKQLLLPQSLEKIGTFAFWAVPLEELRLPSGLFYIGADICKWGDENNQPRTPVFEVENGTYAHRWAIASHVEYVLVE